MPHGEKEAFQWNIFFLNESFSVCVTRLPSLHERKHGVSLACQHLASHCTTDAGADQSDCSRQASVSFSSAHICKHHTDVVLDVTQASLLRHYLFF